MTHAFTDTILTILEEEFGSTARLIFKSSELLQYLNIKTRAASSGSKSRASFGNLYALYVLVEDYINNDFDQSGVYCDYEGAKFSDLLKRQRELPFGSKLQNHALNHRLNQEFHKIFPACEYTPIMRVAETKRYWINENLITVEDAKGIQNISHAIIRIINAYIDARKEAFEGFIRDCNNVQNLKISDPTQVSNFISDLLRPNVDARIFEIVSYSILKEFYHSQVIYWGWSLDSLNEERLMLYKTGRTNANDGGIDFVMRPLGRFFQVTETLDFKKYFLDIDKVQQYPITFVIKSPDSTEILMKKIEEQAHRIYRVSHIVQRYMDCIDEIINITTLLEHFSELTKTHRITKVMNEIVLQSKIEFNYEH